VQAGIAARVARRPQLGEGSGVSIRERGDHTRTTVTVASGTLEPGAVLRDITATGACAAQDPAAVHGTETAVAVF
jgi:hypothetical protein